MSPQRTVNVDQSVRLLKLYWWFLEEGPEGVTFENLCRAQNEITIKGNLYNIQQIIDWNPLLYPRGSQAQGVPQMRILIPFPWEREWATRYLDRSN